jgi:hypothetical protein
MGVHSSECTPKVFWRGRETGAGGGTPCLLKCHFGGRIQVHECPAPFSSRRQEPQTRTMTGKRTALPTRVRTSTHRLQVDSELGPAKTSLRVGLSKCDFPYPCSQSIRLIGDWMTSLKIGCERIISHFPFRESMHPLHPEDGVNTCCKMVYGESAGARTQDQRLKRAMLYQLSYALLPPNNGSTSSP